MKQLSKMMLAAVASVCVAVPAFAWDFSASGSATARMNMTSTTTKTGADANSAGSGFSSEGGGLTLSSSNTDGAKSVSLSYSLDWDGNLDETITVSGSNKVGDWTASGSVSYNPQTLGCYATDNGTAASTAATACAGGQTGEDTTAVTVTDGTMTIVLGDAGHLSSQNVSSSTVSGGAISHDGAGEDAGIGAMVDSFHGVSLGYKISDTMSATVAYQASGDSVDLHGTQEALDGETNATHGQSGFGIGFSGTFGPATVGFTQASASTSNSSGVAAYDAQSTSSSTMGLGVKIALGDIKPFISYGTTVASAAVATTKEYTHEGSEVGLVYDLGSDSVVIYLGNSSDQYSTTDKPLTKSGMELGYHTSVGPASLKIGYGTQTKADDDDADVDGYSMSDLEVSMGFSF
ncbi:MAG: hypothetical protein HOI10_01820 [Deltaproteobacteria bacterium]|jgi:hypothetical protein|nr:hypothetical protein [Deltaproteobacteria bacterium]